MRIVPDVELLRRNMEAHLARAWVCFHDLELVSTAEQVDQAQAILDLADRHNLSVGLVNLARPSTSAMTAAGDCMADPRVALDWFRGEVIAATICSSIGTAHAALSVGVSSWN